MPARTDRKYPDDAFLGGGRLDDVNEWRCPLCGEVGKKTREHVLPLWLGNLLFDTWADDAPLNVSYRFTRYGEDKVIERSRETERPEVVVRDVCKRCNTGWMSKLESAAKPLLSPLVLGHPARLEMAQQVTIAHWAAKTVALIERFATDSVVFEDGDVDEIRDVGAPMGFHVRLAYRPRFAEPFDIVASTAHVITRNEADADVAAGRSHRVGDANNFLVTFAFGGLVIAVAGGPGIRRDGRWVDGGEQPLMVWPPTIGGISWPPAAPVIRSKADLHKFHEALYIRTLNPEVGERIVPPTEPSSR